MLDAEECLALAVRASSGSRRVSCTHEPFPTALWLYSIARACAIGDLMKGVILLAALAATSGCSTTFARPVEAESTPSRVVTFGDLDLRNSADVRVLHNRIRRAAVQVCGGPVRPHDVAQF